MRFGHYGTPEFDVTAALRVTLVISVFIFIARTGSATYRDCRRWRYIWQTVVRRPARLRRGWRDVRERMQSTELENPMSRIFSMTMWLLLFALLLMCCARVAKRSQPRRARCVRATDYQ